MENLPFELFKFIYRNLELIDLMNCARVCKKLKQTVQDYRIDELIFNNNHGMIDAWFYTNKLPNYSNCVFQDYNLTFLRSSSFDLSRLKKLKLDYSVNEDKNFKLTVLNSFVQLVELEIKLNHYKSDEIIELNNLEILSIELTDSNFKELVCPKLFALYLDYIYSNEILEPIQFRHPQTVSHLEVKEYVYWDTEEVRAKRCLGQFSNVRYFKTHAEVMKDFHKIFPNVKTINFACRLEEVDEDDLGIFLNDVAYVHAFKDLLKTNQLEAYFFGLNFTALDRQYNDYDNYFSMRMNNYHLLEPKLNWVKWINFGDLDSYINNLPNDFYDRFFNIQSLYAHDVKNQDQFSSFIGRLKNLHKLELNDANLDQQFYERLPAIHSLTQININEGRDLQLDFGFVHKIQLLHTFQSNQQLSVNQVVNAFIGLRYLENVTILTEDNIFAKKRNRSYNLMYKEKGVNKNLLREFSSLVELKNFCDECLKDV